MKKLSVIVVNYNTRDILRDCIKNIEGKYPNMEVFVVDNSSPDGSAQMVKDEFPKNKFPWLTLIECPNKGLAYGYNQAREKSTGDYQLYMGPDAFPEKNTLEGLVDWMEKVENEKVGIATCKLVQRDLQLDMDAHRGFPKPWTAISHFLGLDGMFPKSRLFNGYFMGWENMEVPHEIDLCISHFMMIRKEVFDELKKWDEDYFLYGEDVDLCWRAKEAGWRIYYVPMWTAIHYKGASVGVRESTQDVTTASPETKLKMYKASANTMKIFYNKHWKSKYPAWFQKAIFLAVDAIALYRTIRAKIRMRKITAKTQPQP